MSKSDPYKDSPYDASGMPLGAETADYDNFAEVAQKMVKDKVITYPENINQAEGYEEAVIDTEGDVTEEGFNSAIADNVNSAYPLDVETSDTADTGDSRKLSVERTEDGFTETVEAPLMGNSAFLDKGREDHDAFLAALEPEKPVVEEEKKDESK